MEKRYLLLIITLLLLPQTVVAIPAQGTNRRADVNRDGNLDVGDVNTILQVILDNQSSAYDCDINSDGRLDVGDVNDVLGLILNPEPFYDPEQYLSRTLPVLYINTDGFRQINSKDVYLRATYWLDPMAQPGVAAIGSVDTPLSMQIKGRGNITWISHEKKPYRIKLDSKQPLMGMSPNKHFVLMAHINDGNEFFKDEIGFEFSRRIGMPYTVRQHPIELVLNGNYVGLYDLCEKIRIDKNRVNIEEQKDKETREDKVSGGWLMEIDNYWWEQEFVELPEKKGKPLYISFQSPEVLSTVQRNYVTDFLTKVHNAVNCEDKTDNTWEKYIDKVSLAKYYIVNEIMDNTESFSGSCYMYKDFGDATKLMFGPVWDFGSAAAGEWAGRGEKFLYEDVPIYVTNHWIEEMVKFPAFMDCVREQWQFLEQSGGLDFDNYLDEWVNHIKKACESEYKRWPKDSQANNIENNKRYFSQSLKSKIAFLKQQWSE